MVINACVEKRVDIYFVAAEIILIGARVNILPNIGVLIINAPDSANIDELLEKIKRIDGIKSASLDCDIQQL